MVAYLLYVLGIAGNNFTYRQKITDKPNLRVENIYNFVFHKTYHSKKQQKIKDI